MADPAQQEYPSLTTFLLEIALTIIVLLVAAATLLFLTGWGAYRLCEPPEDAMPTGTELVFGYSLAIVLFLPLYFLVGNAYVTVYCILFLALFINAFVFMRILRTKSLYLTSSDNIQKHGVEYALFIGVILIAAIPYVSSGLGNYWHSGNEDIFDGLNGRNAYIKNELLDNSSTIDLSTRVGGTLSSILAEQIWSAPKINSKLFRDRYVHEPGRLQYSSLAYFSALLNLPKGMDVFMIQALLNLGFFALGVYAFVRHAFLQKKYIAALSAIISTLGNFYLTTYVNGHQGSLMYNAATPFILNFAVIGIREHQLMGRWLIVPTVMLLMVLLAYPYPLPYVVVPVAVYAALSWLTVRKGKHSIIDIFADRRSQIAALILSLVGFVVAYIFADPLRVRALSQFRSWGTAINHIGFLQFWGLWPSGAAFSETSLAWLDSQPNLKAVSLITATAFSVLSLFGFYRLLKQGVTFVAVWVPLCIFFFLVMRFAVYDSYYVYKFLYINAWIVISATVVAIGYLIENDHLFPRMAGAVVMLLWLIPNIINNTSTFQGLSHSSFNEHPSSYYHIIEAPHPILEKTYIDIPIDTHEKLVRQMLGDNNITIKRSKAEASFILHERGVKDIYSEKTGEIVWESDIFTIARKSEHDWIEIATYWQPEGANTGRPFRWVSDRRIANVLVDVQQRSQMSNFMYVCGESGPSIDFRPIELKVFDKNRKLAGSMLLGKYACQWVDISSFQSPFSLEHAEQGKIVSYVDNRKLVYRIMHIGFASANSAAQLPQQLSLTEDICKVGKLALGKNWYPFETFGGESFRWVNNGAEILLKGVEAKGTLVMEAEPGPSAGHPIKVHITSTSGKELGIYDLSERTVLSIPLQFESAGDQHLQINSDADGRRLATDHRILNFLIFKLAWKDQNRER